MAASDGAKTPPGAEVEKLALQVFATMAKGADSIAVEDFRKNSAILAQMSADFAGNEPEVLNRMDLNRDKQIDAKEFLHEVFAISEKIGITKVYSSLLEVQHVAERFERSAEAEVLEEDATARRQATASSRGRPVSGRAPSTASTSRLKPVFGGYPREDPSGLGSCLDISPKPLHERTRQGRKGQMRAREKVLENMLDYFRKLREDYEAKLASVKQQNEEMKDLEEVGIRFTPTEPHGMLLGPADGGAATDAAADAATTATTATAATSTAAAAKAAADLAAGGERPGLVRGLAPDGQAEKKGVEAQWVIDKINDQDFTPELLQQAQNGDEDYFVTFLRPLGGQQAPGPPRIFSDFTPGERKNKKKAGAEGEEEQGEEEEEDDDEDEEEEEGGVGDKPGTILEQEGEDDEDEEEGADAEDGAEDEEDDESDDDEEESDDDDDEDDEDDEEDAEDEEAAEGGKGEGEGEGEEGEAGGDEKAKKPAEEGPEEGEEDTKKEDPEATLLPRDSSTANEKAEAAPPSPKAAEEKEATAPATTLPGAITSDAEGAAGDDKKGAKKEKKDKKAKKEKKDKKEKKEKTGKEKGSSGAVGRSSPSPPPSRAGLQSSRASSPSPDASASEALALSTSARPTGLKQVKGKIQLEEEGVSCVKTLDMGLAIRSAICIGKEVWCADWKGAVTIRERDDASSVKAEIPTNRFIWCMAHMEPGLLWMGQESQGISLFDIKTKSFKTVLTGGHTGGVHCLALDEGLGDLEETGFPVRRGWSGSNDFTIRQWWIESWATKGPTPEKVQRAPGKYTTVTVGKFSLGVAAGLAMHGHTNGVRALLKIGPTLWSGSDDGSIRIWDCGEGSCLEVVEDAHKGSVLKLSVVRSFVWSAGADGSIKEWQIGTPTKCVRKVCPPGCERGVYSIVPLGRDVWSCGHHPNIRVLSQSGMDIFDEYEAHNPYVSNLLAIDRVETRIVWSTSLADRKLKVWRHTVRGNVPSFDELKAANALYERDAQSSGEKLGKILATVAELEAQLAVAGQEYQVQLEDLARRFAEEQEKKDELAEAKRFLEEEMAGLQRLFDEAGLGHLLKDPEALRAFLDLKRLFDEAGLGHLLNDPEALKKFLSMGKLFKELGLEDLLTNPAALRAFLETAKEIQDVLKSLGLDHLWRDPQKLKAMLEAFSALKKVLEDYGLGEAVGDPSKLAEVLSRYNAMRNAFEEFGFSELFEDPYTLKGFLRNYGRIREEFKNVGMEYLLDSPQAMKDFLAKYLSGQTELQDLQALREKLALLEAALNKSNKELEAARTELASVKSELAAYKEICPTLDELKKMKEEAGQFRTLKKLKRAQDKELEDLKKLLEDKERERAEALERERQMALKYKELDIFKLDIIARELKALDNELTGVGRTAKNLLTDASRLRNLDEKEAIGPHGDHILDQCKDLRGHIRDVINKCLNETQRMHIGVAVDDHLAAGDLKQGGVMAGWICEEVDRPDHGNSKAGKLCQNDALTREVAQNGGTLPLINGRRTPGAGDRPQASRPSSRLD